MIRLQTRGEDYLGEGFKCLLFILIFFVAEVVVIEQSKGIVQDGVQAGGSDLWTLSKFSSEQWRLAKTIGSAKHGAREVDGRGAGVGSDILGHVDGIVGG